jgi:DNA-directed RNA polymerase specialized sigma24 family protein
LTDDAQSAYTADDAILLNLVRIGDTGAYGVLRQRHEHAARRFAGCLVAAEEIDDLVAGTFARALDVTVGGGGPADAFRPYLLAALRRVSSAAQHAISSDAGEPADPGQPVTDPAEAILETSAFVRAFRSLPDRWIAVLWHTEIERTSPAETSQILGLNPKAVAALGRRALDGLQEAYLQVYLAEAARPECQPVARQLAAFARDGALSDDSSAVGEHLGHCDECRTAYAELTNISSALGSRVAPVFLGRAAAAYLSAGDTQAITAASQAEPTEGATAEEKPADGGTATPAAEAGSPAARSRAVPRRLLWSAACAAAVGALVVAFVLSGHPGSPASPSPHQQAQAAAAPTPDRTTRKPAAKPSAKGPTASSQPRSAPAKLSAPSSAARAAGPVTVGGAGPSSSGAVASNASRLSWTQAVSGSNTALLVGVAVGENGGVTGLSASVTDNGTAMRALATISDDNQPDGYLEVFGLAGVPDGGNAISLTVTGGTAAELTGGSESFDGAAQTGTFSSAATAYGDGTTPAVSVGSRSGGMVAAFAACGSSILSTAPPAAQGFIADDDDSSGAGNSAGATSSATGGAVTVSWSAYDDFWGAAAIQVNS